MEGLFSISKSMNDNEFSLLISEVIKSRDTFSINVDISSQFEIVFNLLSKGVQSIDIYSLNDIEEELDLNLLGDLEYRIVSNFPKNIANFHSTEKESDYSFFILFSHGNFILKEGQNLTASFNQVHEYNELLNEFSKIIN